MRLSTHADDAACLRWLATRDLAGSHHYPLRPRTAPSSTCGAPAHAPNPHQPSSCQALSGRPTLSRCRPASASTPRRTGRSAMGPDSAPDRMTAEGSDQLTLAEQLLLMAIKRSGGVHRSAQMALDFGLVSALLLELALRGKVELVRDSLVCQEGAKPTGDSLLDEAFERVSDPEAQPRLLRTLVSTLRPGSGRWRDRVGLRLVERGLLTVKRGGLLGRLRRPR